MKAVEYLRSHWLKITIITLAVAVLAVWLGRHLDEFSKEAVIDFGKQIHALWFVTLFLVLPLAGFPISVLLVISGIRFGFWGGFAMSAIAVAFHHFAAYRLAHGLFRTRMRNFLNRSGYGIPPIDEKHRIRFTMVFAAVHGPPYFVKLYALALTDIPFAVYLAAGAPVYVLFCAFPLAIGSAATSMELGWIHYGLGGIALLITLWYGFKKLRKRRLA